MANGHGGKRPGAGRKRGSRNKRTLELVKMVEKSGLTPVNYMLSVMRDKSVERKERLDAAKAVAPYIHARLASSEVDIRSDKQSASEYSMDELLASVSEPIFPPDEAA